ncbi:MAG: EthD family reductase [Myxococcota bacterium]
MHIIEVIYPTPDDPEAFKAYYAETHVPLVARLPGLRSYSYGYPKALGPGDAPFCIFRAAFDSAEAMMSALQSEQGQKVAADVPNYSPKGATMVHFPEE